MNSSWEGNVNQIKVPLNHCRKAMGLSELTDQDLQIEGKIPNEGPQIPDGEKPKPIKDGVADIEKYNKSFDKENNETVRKFLDLRGMIYDMGEDLNKFHSVIPSLFKQVDNKAVEAEE